MRSIITQSRTDLFENEYNRIVNRSIDADAVLSGALAAAPTIATVFPPGNVLADQLKMVARMISAASALGAKRQVFFVSLGGFDTHDGLLTVHPGLLTSVSSALSAFYSATVELAVADKVTTFPLLRHAAGGGEQWS